MAAPFPPEMLVTVGVLSQAAKKYHALVVGFENRYYGRSLNPDMLRLENLKFLTFEQGLLDFAFLQEEVNSKLKVSKNTWIVFGGSYSGVTSAFYRQKYPHLVSAAVSSSAPVDMSFNAWKYWSQVGWQIANTTMGGSQACYQAVYDSFTEVDSLIKSGNYAKLKSDFNFCEPSLDLTDYRTQFTVGTAISGPFGNLAYHNEMTPGVSYRALVCPRFTNKSHTPYEALKQFLALEQKGEIHHP